jgi:hypothetical protein
MPVVNSRTNILEEETLPRMGCLNHLDELKNGLTFAAFVPYGTSASLYQ